MSLRSPVTSTISSTSLGLLSTLVSISRLFLLPVAHLWPLVPSRLAGMKVATWWALLRSPPRSSVIRSFFPFFFAPRVDPATFYEETPPSGRPYIMFVPRPSLLSRAHKAQLTFSPPSSLFVSQVSLRVSPAFLPSLRRPSLTSSIFLVPAWTPSLPGQLPLEQRTR